MNDSVRKPKLVFFRPRYDADVPAFLLIHTDEHVKCLSEFFDVTVIDEDCDYQRICDTYEPDVALFELGLQVRSAHRLSISNTHVCAGVPKLAFLHADAWGETRACILSDMEHLAIETAFSNCTTMAEHMPAIAEHLFAWPNFVDADTYRDYRESKLVPVLITGCQDPQYPWRHKVYRMLSESYPSLVCPHHGYHSRLPAGHTMVGERYARTINSAWFAPTCGTVAKEAVRKHFEIPGSRACLITEASPALTAAGFIDMRNCVFADEHDVVEKVAYLFAHQDVLTEITNAGHELVHARHTLRQRDQVFQWFRLFKSLTPGQRIIQHNPFEAPIAIEKTSTTTTSHIFSGGLHLALVREGDELLWSGKYEEAERSYTTCLNYVGGMAEPKLKIALCNLYQGNPRGALARIVPPIKETLAGYGAADPDPVEWAYFIICLLCLGKLRAARKRACQFPSLDHPELARARFAVDVLTGTGNISNVARRPAARHRASLHHLPARSQDEWIEQLGAMLRACGRFSLAKSLKSRLATGRLSGAADAPSSSSFLFGGNGSLQGFDNPLLVSRLQDKLSSGILKLLHRLEAKYGYFLPYSLSAMRNDEFFKAIRHVAREETIATALVVGAGIGEGGTEAFLAGAGENEHRPSVFCINSSGRKLHRPNKSLANGPLTRWYSLKSSSAKDLSQELETTIKVIMDGNNIKAFDAVLIDGSAFTGHLINSSFLLRELHKAAFILLDDINGSNNHNTQSTFLRDSRYVLVAHNPGWRKGYAIFKRECATAGINDGRHAELTEAYG